MQQTLNMINKTTREKGKQVKFILPFKKQSYTSKIKYIFPLSAGMSDEILPFDHFMSWQNDAM